MQHKQEIQHPAPVPTRTRPVSDMIVEAFRNGHPVWQIAARCQVPRSRVMSVLVQRGEINVLTTGEVRSKAIINVPAPKAEASA